jgi:flavin reductase (DIM6/NTAB) family NADH-FMN oxidoreductase RutF
VRRSADHAGFGRQANLRIGDDPCCQTFAINYLPQEQRVLADIFGGKSGVKGIDRFATTPWTTLTTGAPVLEGAVGAIDCELIEPIERYSVVMLLGRVVATYGNSQAVPLVHFRGGYLP